MENITSSNYIKHHFVRYIIFPFRIGQSSDGNMILHFRRCSYYVNNFIYDTVTIQCPRWEKDKRLSDNISLQTRRPNDWAELVESEGYRTRNSTLTLYSVISDTPCLFCLAPLFCYYISSSRPLTVHLTLSSCPIRIPPCPSTLRHY